MEQTQRTAMEVMHCDGLDKRNEDIYSIGRSTWRVCLLTLMALAKILPSSPVAKIDAKNNQIV